MIYLDHNATSPVHPQVLEAMLPFFTEQWGNPSSPHRFGFQARNAVEQARRRIAALIGCEPSEIVFCASGTESDNLAVRGVARSLRSKGNHIVTSAIEHHAVLNTCKALEEEGYRVTYLPVSRAGRVDPGDLRASLCPETVLVTIMHANNETGVIQPIEELAAIAKKRGVVFHTDAVQSLGKTPFRVDGLGIDLTSFSGHKLYGPKGIGVLMVRRGTPITAMTTGGAHEHGLRAGTENTASIVGLAKAMELCAAREASESVRVGALRQRLERQVTEAIPASRVNGGDVARVPNTSSLSFDGVDGESIILNLDLRGICVSTGSACSTGEPEPSHVLRAMGVSPRAAQGTIRVSLGTSTREQDIDTTVRALVESVAKLRLISSTAGAGS